MASSHVLLALVALSGVFALAQADNAWVVSAVYTTNTCAAGSQLSNTTVAAGVCNYVAADGSSWAQFCGQGSDSNIYRYTYTDANCTIANNYQIVQNVPWCQAVGAYSTQTFCANAAAGPAPPATFPPSGWVSITSCRNSTTGQAATQCSAATGLTCINSAMKAGVCLKRSSAYQTVGSTASYCSADGAWGGSVVFNSATCDPSTILRADLSPTGCNGGTSISCSGSSSTLPSGIPNQGVISYPGSSTCVPLATNAARVSLYGSACVDSTKFACQTTGNVTATITSYSDSTQKGLCTTQVATNTYAAVNTPGATPAYCLSTGTTANPSSQSFTCNWSNGNPSPASTVSVSAVAMLAAAFLALVASRSL